MGKPKKKVKCTICTKHRWKGNKKSRFKHKDQDKKKRMKSQIDEIEKSLDILVSHIFRHSDLD